MIYYSLRRKRFQGNRGPTFPYFLEEKYQKIDKEGHHHHITMILQLNKEANISNKLNHLSE